MSYADKVKTGNVVHGQSNNWAVIGTYDILSDLTVKHWMDCNTM